MIVLLLLSSKSWCQNNNATLPLRAIEHKDSLINVTIPINYIKQANIKLTERKYFIRLNNEKDSIIMYYKDYVANQDIIINKLNNNYLTAVEVNKNIKKDLELQQRKTKLFTYTSISLVAITLLTILAK